jgi:hypothetical protein
VAGLREAAISTLSQSTPASASVPPNRRDVGSGQKAWRRVLRGGSKGARDVSTNLKMAVTESVNSRLQRRTRFQATSIPVSK